MSQGSSYTRHSCLVLTICHRQQVKYIKMVKTQNRAMRITIRQHRTEPKCATTRQARAWRNGKAPTRGSRRSITLGSLCSPSSSASPWRAGPPSSIGYVLYLSTYSILYHHSTASSLTLLSKDLSIVMSCALFTCQVQVRSSILALTSDLCTSF